MRTLWLMMKQREKKEDVCSQNNILGLSVCFGNGSWQEPHQLVLFHTDLDDVYYRGPIMLHQCCPWPSAWCHPFSLWVTESKLQHDTAAYTAAHALNPPVPVDVSDNELTCVFRDLTSYGVDKLHPVPIQDIIDEITKYHTAISSTWAAYWSKVEGATQYDHNLSKKGRLLWQIFWSYLKRWWYRIGTLCMGVISCKGHIFAPF